MDLGPLFPGMVDTAGALLPALVSIVIVLCGRARCGLGAHDQLWLVVLSVVLSAALSRVSVTPEAVSLHIIPGATAILCYLVWRGYTISPGLAFALTYATTLPADFVMARLATGTAFNSECIGGNGWCDGLLILPALTALAVVYANWRMATSGQARRIGGARRLDRRRAERHSGGLRGMMAHGG